MIQVIQQWKFVVYSRDESLQVLKKHLEVDVVDTITALKREDYSLFCSGIVDVVKVVDGKWKGR